MHLGAENKSGCTAVTGEGHEGQDVEAPHMVDDLAAEVEGDTAVAADAATGHFEQCVNLHSPLVLAEQDSRWTAVSLVELAACALQSVSTW